MRLNQWLLDRYKAGETAVLIIDEAQNLSANVLEEIRLLTNLETSTEKLLQIVLAGQPELEQKLSRPELRQLRQRVTLQSRTLPLSLEKRSDTFTSACESPVLQMRTFFLWMLSKRSITTHGVYRGSRI